MDLHLHSRYSHDSRASLESIVARCREVGLGRIALTDHNTAAGALELARREPGLAIAGEEVRTVEGEVIGLFVTATIPPGLSPEETMNRIHAMGGLTYVPHPFDRRRAHFSLERLAELAGSVDIVETYNSWCDEAANEAARRFAEELGIPAASGSDSHAPSEIGHSWMEMEPFEGPQDLLDKLRTARHRRTPSSGAARRA